MTLQINRRHFLRLLAGAGALSFLGLPAPLLAAEGKDGLEPFHWARLKFKVTQKVSDIWAAHPVGDEVFLDFLYQETSLNVDRTWHVASLDNLDDMVQYPFLFMTAEGRIEFTKKQQENLREYLKRGGFLFADDCVAGTTGDFFFLDIKDKVETLFGQKMVRLPNDHALYRCFHKLDGLPYMQGTDHGGWGLFLDGRMAMYLSPVDIHCGWTSVYIRRTRGNGWFPAQKEHLALQMGVNILTYALTH